MTEVTLLRWVCPTLLFLMGLFGGVCLAEQTYKMREAAAAAAATADCLDEIARIKK